MTTMGNIKHSLGACAVADVDGVHAEHYSWLAGVVAAEQAVVDLLPVVAGMVCVVADVDLFHPMGCYHQVQVAIGLS